MARPRRTLYTLNVNGYSPEITSLTFPLIKHYAHKIGAEFCEIRERRFIGWPVVYEKLQIHRLAEERSDEWSLYLDADALVHPETPDWTVYLPRDTVAHNGIDFANVRWRYDEYFLRDGRNVGSCNWNAIASAWCRDLWRPLEDLTLEQALDNIYPTVDELHCGVIDKAHLLDDYVLSRNIARFGLKVQQLMELQKKLGFVDPAFYWHGYTMPPHDYPGLRVKSKADGTVGDIETWKFDERLHEKVESVMLPGKVTQLKGVLKLWRINPARLA